MTNQESFPRNLCLESKVSEWYDKYGHKRSHVFCAGYSGMTEEDIEDVEVINNGSALKFILKWPAEMFFANRILTHTRFGNHYNQLHPKWIALQKKMNEGMGKEKDFKSTVIIKLRGSDFVFTDEAHSGHPSRIVINHTQDTPQKTPVICFFDLCQENKNNSHHNFSERAMLSDDFEVG